MKRAIYLAFVAGATLATAPLNARTTGLGCSGRFTYLGSQVVERLDIRVYFDEEKNEIRINPIPIEELKVKEANEDELRFSGLFNDQRKIFSAPDQDRPLVFIRGKIDGVINRYSGVIFMWTSDFKSELRTGTYEGKCVIRNRIF